MKKYVNHFKTVMTHKYYVFMEMREYGLYWQGLTHDLSKFLPSEFRQAKYYTGTRSPISIEKEQVGYSKTWLKHIHRNKHHWEYWYDPTINKIAPIPEKYMKEMVCDTIAASKAYNGKSWTPQTLLDYMETRSTWPDEIKALTMPLILAKLQKERS
ncbi:DUF5662 family protein [Lachnospiraceae bacterium OttesenSCG-928-E19]|nr:DUF5662 family protein [Lachnospiraceae bacterium OttesenSCG-928-E19]